MTLREALESERALVADGATGTWLQQRGLANGEAPERWNLDRPEAIRDLAQGYISAGSDLIYTNTFGGNRIRLRLAGLDARADEINREAVRLAREAMESAGRKIFLVASIGPTGEMLEPFGDLTEDEVREVFEEQCALLAAAGVDGFACETFTALEEATLAVEAACKVADGRPVFASMAFEHGGRTMMGVTPEQAVHGLFSAGADLVGANCSIGPEVVGPVIRAMAAARPGSRLLAKPNAGLPRVEGQTTLYPVKPSDLAVFASEVLPLGVRVLGGCCGTTPDHIRAIKEALS